MPKQKTRKSMQKRFTLTSRGKLLRRHQLGAGTHRQKKAKSALGRHMRISEVFKGDSKKLKRLLGV